MAFNSRKPSLPLRTAAGLLLAVLALHATAKATHDPKLKSSSVLVIDQSDSTVLYARHADVPMPIASITKLMTALVVLDAKQPLDEPLRITAADHNLPKGGVSRLSVGTVLSRGDLMHLALMSSENHAAHALGSNYPGGIPAMVDAMNAKAAALGMTRSHFVDPTGLSSQNVASPADLSKLVIAATHNSRIRQYSTDRHYSVMVRRRMVEFRNTDNLVANPHWNIVVQKTGYINEAGRCLVMAAVIEGRSVVIVLLDSFGKYTRVADAQRVKTWMEARANERVQVSMR
ncbi:MAG TPA: D-alanyl-D-alanine endopeptidase [Steroidobacteraceae bacterium]|nr:D-alanyl-D-alanine endopeptidase [Steroidobacteraceae bacterium]